LPKYDRWEKIIIDIQVWNESFGATPYTLGIRVSRDRNSRLLYFDHETYLENLIKRFEIDKSKPLSTPVSTGQNLSKKMCYQDET